MVSKVVSLRHAWCHGQCRHATHDVMGGVVAPRVVSQAVLLHGRGGCHVMAAFVAWLWWVSSCCVVSRWVSSCHGRNGCVTPCGVTVAVVTLHGGVIVMVVTLRVVSRSWPSCRVVLWLWRVSSHHHHGW